MVLLLAFACDDTEFPSAGGTAVTGDNYSDVQTIFSSACVGCHGGATPFAGLDLETDPCAAIVDVASSGGDPYVVPGDSAASVLWHRVADTGTYGVLMPPGNALPQASIDTIAAWIDAGASCEDPVAALSVRAHRRRWLLTSSRL